MLLYAFLCFMRFHMFLYTLSYALIRFDMLSYTFICFHTLLHAFTCFYLLLLDKLSEQQQQQEMLPLCLTGFYLRKPVKTPTDTLEYTVQAFLRHPQKTLDNKLEISASLFKTRDFGFIHLPAKIWQPFQKLPFRGT